MFLNNRTLAEATQKVQPEKTQCLLQETRFERLKRLEKEGKFFLREKVPAKFIEMRTEKKVRKKYINTILYKDKYGTTHAAMWESPTSSFNLAGVGIKDPNSISIENALERISEGEKYLTAVTEEKIGTLQNLPYADNISEQDIDKEKITRWSEEILEGSARRDFINVTEKKLKKKIRKHSLKTKEIEVELRRIDDPTKGFGLAPGWGFLDKIKIGEGLVILNDTGLAH